MSVKWTRMQPGLYFGDLPGGRKIWIERMMPGSWRVHRMVLGQRHELMRFHTLREAKDYAGWKARRLAEGFIT